MYIPSIYPLSLVSHHPFLQSKNGQTPATIQVSQPSWATGSEATLLGGRVCLHRGMKPWGKPFSSWIVWSGNKRMLLKTSLVTMVEETCSPRNNIKQCQTMARLYFLANNKHSPRWRKNTSSTLPIAIIIWLPFTFSQLHFTTSHFEFKTGTYNFHTFSGPSTLYRKPPQWHHPRGRGRGTRVFSINSGTWTGSAPQRVSAMARLERSRLGGGGSVPGGGLGWG